MIDDLWYKNAVVYCLDVRTFQDASGDGIGDFSGLRRKLPYLAGIGVTCVWLLPFQCSPDRDDGYDITDYYSVDPRFGTLGDFVQFSRDARSLGIRVIIDLVVNHTSNEHRWFQEARRDPRSRYRDYYVWSKKRPKDATKGMVFPGVQKSTWSWDEQAGLWYFHRFYDFQPDLATSHPAVQEEIRNIMGFWIELGVAGFRMDAVPFVIHEKGPGAPNVEHFDMLRDLRDFVQWRRGDAILLGEANVLPKDDMRYFGDEGERLQMMFNFQVNQHVFHALATGDARSLAKALLATKERPSTAQWGQFLRNNDELDLGRLTEEEREHVFSAFGSDPSMQLYDRGIRRRLAPMLGGDRARIELAYSLMFTLPGTPVLRAGDEIGMGDDLRLPERQAARTPMQWSSDAQGGFSTSARTVLPVIERGPFGYRTLNVAAQRRDPSSLLNWMERIIRMRKECPEIGWGDFAVLDTGDRSVLAIRYAYRSNAVVVVHNLEGSAREVSIRPKGQRSALLTSLLDESHSEADRRGVHRLELEAWGYRWFREGGLTDVLERTPSPAPRAVPPKRKRR